MTAYIEFSETEVKELVGKIPIETLSAIIESKTDNQYAITLKAMIKDLHNRLIETTSKRPDYRYAIYLEEYEQVIAETTWQVLRKWQDELQRLKLYKIKADVTYDNDNEEK